VRRFEGFPPLPTLTTLPTMMWKPFQKAQVNSLQMKPYCAVLEDCIVAEYENKTVCRPPASLSGCGGVPVFDRLSLEQLQTNSLSPWGSWMTAVANWH
jgi:hypothetical protein